MSNLFITKPRKLFFLIFLISILIIGCGTSEGGTSSSPFSSFPSFKSSSPTSKKISDINLYVGTSGLTAEFAKAAPPPKVFEQSSFPILLKIRNSGAYSITDNRPALLSIGRERDYISKLTIYENENIKPTGIADNEALFKLGGKAQINPQGDEALFSVDANTGKLDPQSENKQSSLTATICYPYKTILSTTVCIDPDVGNMRPGKKACTVKDITFSNGQGAPISVVRIEPQMIPVVGPDQKEYGEIKPQFLIFVENKGRGTPVDIIDYPRACRSRDLESIAGGTRLYWNGATIRVFTSRTLTSGEKPVERQTEEIEKGKITLDRNELLCCPNFNGECKEKINEYETIEQMGFLRFRDRKDYIRCTFRQGVARTADAYTSPLRVEIDYGYVQTISTSFLIQKPLKY
jgi:hypothetical protein